VKIELAYGKTRLNISLPDDLHVTVIAPKYVAGLPDPAGAVRDALRRPIASRPLKELVKSSDKIGIVFNDITRPTPYHIILPVLLDELSHVRPDRITLLNATGTHRANTEVELREMLRDGVVDKYRIIQHDARDRDSHTFVGTTTSGNDIWLLTEYIGCDVRILTGFIEPHFFAGFSGGGKACMPGLALLETVLNNHSSEKIDHPMARWGLTEGNPVWEEIRQAASMAAPTFLLNVALNRDKQITGVFAGHFEKAHEQGCEFVKDRAMAPVKEPFDIVITSNSGYTLDLNL
jgi:nickel-dependent lactate racemase